MGFFDLGNGTNALTTSNGTADVGGGNFDPIPENRNVRAVIDDIAWSQVPVDFDNNPGVDYINVRWSVIAPKEYHGRKIFQKLWVSAQGQPSNNDPAAKRVKDLCMLAAINANCPGQPLNQCQAAPSDVELSKLKSVVCMLKMGVWEINGKSGNFISQLEGSTSQPATAPARKPAPAAQPQQQQAPVAPQPTQQQAPFPEADGGSVDGDEIPF